MEDLLFQHITKFVSLSPEDFETIAPYFEMQQIQKKESVLNAGELSNKMHFVAKGCLHTYFTDETGTDKTIQFAIENWWISDLLTFHYQKTTQFTIRAIENSTIFSIEYSKYQELLKQFPQMEAYFRAIFEIGYGAMINRFKYLYSYSKEESYFSFQSQFPEFVNRVPQYILATYLGLTPEYLSKLRAKKIS